MLLRGRNVQTGTLVDIEYADGAIVAMSSARDGRVDHEADWIVPGFFDLQVNGGGGVSFNSASLTTEQVSQSIRLHAQHGVSGLLPTLITNHPDALAHAFYTLDTAREHDDFVAAHVPGYHLEGPWISPEDGFRGAHPREHICAPNWGQFVRYQDAAGWLIKMVTLAPELPGALPFIERLTRDGLVVALGHTNACAGIIADAIKAGARLSTHLGNGIAAALPRHANPLWEQLAHDELWTSVIADGHHLTPAVLQCILRVKGNGRAILISDSSSLAGQPPGCYREWDQDIEVTPEGRIVVAGTPYLAGSSAFLDHCFAHAVSTGVSVPDAVAMACERPRELLGIRRANKGLLLMDKRGRILMSFGI